MDWRVLASLAVLGIALVLGLAVCLVTSVGVFARRLAREPEDKRRGFEVLTTTTTTTNSAGVKSAVQREKDDHHG